MRRHRLIFGALAALFLCNPDARAGGSSDAELADAARAIFGDGLLVTRSGGKVTVDWNPKGLTEAKARRYLETYWGPALDDIDPGTVFALADQRMVFPFYTNSLSRHKRAYFLMEPDGRRAICRRIAKQIGDSRLRKKTMDFCTVRAVETATRGVIGFRGKKQSFNARAPWAGVWFKERLWANRDGARQMLVVAPGLDEIEQLDQLTYAANVADVGQTMRDQYSADALRALRRLRDRAADKLAKKAERIAARDKALVGGRASVMFTDYPISGWRKIIPLTDAEKAPCFESHVHAYGPAKPKPKTIYDLTVSLNGRTCATKGYGHHGERTVVHGSLWSFCTGRDKYDSGDNKVEVTLVERGSKTIAAKSAFACRAR